MLKEVGLDYLCVATLDDLAAWTKEAGLIDVAVRDLTGTVRPVWARRPASAGTAILLGDGRWSLGHGLRYIEIRGRKPG